MIRLIWFTVIHSLFCLWSKSQRVYLALLYEYHIKSKSIVKQSYQTTSEDFEYSSQFVWTVIIILMYDTFVSF